MSAGAVLILFGHGSRDPNWAEPMRRMQALIAGRPDAPAVSLAFLEFSAPDLATAIDAAITAGAARIRIAPVFLGQGGHLRRDVTALVAAARANYPEVPIELADAMGESASVIAALADWAAGEPAA